MGLHDEILVSFDRETAVVSRAPGADLASKLESRREWVWNSVSGDDPLDRNDPRTALSVVKALSQAVDASETWKLQSVGIVFGDVLAAMTGSEWVEVEDEYGRDAALRFAGPDDLIFPMTMISKRVEAGDDVDPFSLWSTVAQSVFEIRERNEGDGQ
ncbi:MAG TPA: DUF3806 domain-containing protein [Pseudolysinimonas sp.]|nr:DUF3806 domain-containing protein [Pseudolysinimonas sp.]